LVSSLEQNSQRDLIGELHKEGTASQGGRSFASQAAMMCATKFACTNCKGQRVLYSVSAPFSVAALCECIQECKKCLGTCRGSGSAAKQSSQSPVSSVKHCMYPNPVNVVRAYNQARIPARYSSARLDYFENPSGNGAKEVLPRLKRWLAGYPKTATRGILLSAEVGVGKTYLLTALARSLAMQGTRVRFVDFFQLISELKAAYTDGKADKQLMQPLLSAEVLIIDELGKGRNTDWEQTILDQLVMGRYNQGKVVIASTNFSLEQQQQSPMETYGKDGFNPDKFGQLVDRVGYRVFSRLKESCDFYTLSGADYRSLKARSFDHM
jgi:DNA replication protein DnaC